MNGATGREREERAVDALLISALRQKDSEGDVDAKHLPELTDEEKAAMKALGATSSSGCWPASDRSGRPLGNPMKTAPRKARNLPSRVAGPTTA